MKDNANEMIINIGEKKGFYDDSSFKLESEGYPPYTGIQVLCIPIYRGVESWSE